MRPQEEQAGRGSSGIEYGHDDKSGNVEAVEEVEFEASDDSKVTW